jgi:Rrf2 family protein
MINSRFTVAVHLLTLLSVARETEPDSPVTSEFAAHSVSTNPVVVRRILGNLRRAGLVRSQPGPSGGWQLDREPATVSLRDVYRAVEDEQLFSMHRQPPSTACPVGRNIQRALQGYFQEAEQAMESALGGRSIADVVLDVKRSAAAPLAG